MWWNGIHKCLRSTRPPRIESSSLSAGTSSTSPAEEANGLSPFKAQFESEVEYQVGRKVGVLIGFENRDEGKLS